MANRYRLTYPNKGKIYKSNSLSLAVKQCYKEFKHYNGFSSGMFIVTDIDNKKEYTFKTTDKNKKQEGGNKNLFYDSFNIPIPNESKIKEFIDPTVYPFKNNNILNNEINLDFEKTIDFNVNENNVSKEEIERFIESKLLPIKKQINLITEKIDNGRIL